MDRESSMSKTAFFEATDDGEYLPHPGQPGEKDFINAGKMHEGKPVYYQKSSLRGRLKATNLGKNEYIEGPDDNREKACFNWALMSLTGIGVWPEKVFDYFNKPSSIMIENVPTEKGGEWLKQNKAMLDTLLNEWAEDVPEQANPVATEQITKALIKANGFTITNDETPYKIAMHYPVTQGVTFEHWWITVDDKVIDMLPDRKDIYIKVQEEDHTGRSVIRVNVQKLKQEQVNHILKTLERGKHGEEK
jgi:hypothetical protein